MEKEKFVVMMVIVGEKEEAREIARHLVENKLAACVNILPGVQSIYRWKGKICDDTEFLCIVKTKKALFAKVAEEVKKIHSYELPEIISLRIEQGSDEYLGWLRAETC